VWTELRRRLLFKGSNDLTAARAVCPSAGKMHVSFPLSMGRAWEWINFRAGTDLTFPVLDWSKLGDCWSKNHNALCCLKLWVFALSKFSLVARLPRSYRTTTCVFGTNGIYNTRTTRKCFALRGLKLLSSISFLHSLEAAQKTSNSKHFF
jgi:hypothetical protein